MLSELGRHKEVASTHEFRALRDETRARVLDWLETSAFPEAGGLSGAHDSWLFAFFLAELSASGASMRDRLFELWQSKINPAREEIANFHGTDWDFLDLPGVLASVDYFTPGAHPELFAVGESVPFQSPITDWNAHTAGASMVRLWPHAIQSSQNAASCARYQTRMSEMFARPDQWQDVFETVSHWVPQFMWMGLWLEMGRP
jgi:hypothetical protein